ncbi:MAG: hypothetical protein N2Z20_03160 [Elusimicrobiales bacterium]|nr:hypothetical protein [Elusimicrobiales bacterium]
MAKRVIKKYRPKRKLKLNMIKSNNFIMLLSYAIISVFIVIFIKFNSSKIMKIKDISFTKTTITKIVLKTEDDSLRKEIEINFRNLVSKPYSEELIKSFKNSIATNYPHIRIHEKFNQFTGTLTFDIHKIPAVAKFANIELYLLQDLSFSSKNPNPNIQYPLIDINTNEKTDKNLLSTFIEISKTPLINIGDGNPTFLTEKSYPAIQYDKIRITLPKNFKPSEKDIKKIKKVLDDAKNRLNIPFNIDARYINEGKIIVAPLN